MGRSAGVSRREALTAGLLVAALGLGIGGYTFYREADNARLRKQVEESRIIASRGEWVGIEADGIDYAGTLGVTLLASARYDTLTEAEEAGELGALNEFDVHDGAYIVCEVELDGKDIHVKDGGNNVLNVTILQLMYPGGQTTIHASSVWTSGEPANDEMAGIYGIRFGEGDIVTVRLGFSLPKGVDSDGLRLVYYSRQYQFLLDFENQQA